MLSLSFPVSSVGKESTCNAGDPGSIPELGRSAGEGIGYPLQYCWASLVAKPVKNLPAMRETWVGNIRERLATPVFWPAKFNRLYSPWGHKELDTTQQLSLSLFSAPDSSTLSNKGERGCLHWNKQHPYKRQSASQQCWIISPKLLSSVQSLSCAQIFAIPRTAAHQASLSITNSWSLLKLMSIESMMPSNHLGLCHPLLLPPSVFPSIRVFSDESVLLMRWPKYWSFSFSISPSIEYSGLISFRMDWLDLLIVQGALKSLHLHHSSKAQILRHSAFFIVQLSHPYITTAKTIALARQTIVGKVMSLLFNMLSRFVLVFLPRNKCLLMSQL